MAINSLVHFTFFKYTFFDYGMNHILPPIILAIFVILFAIGGINFLVKNIDIQKCLFLFYLFVCPVLFFIALSFLGIYPFCNRVIIFLIPIFIINIINAFDFNNSKILNLISTIFITSFMLFMFGYEIKISEIKYLLTDKYQYGMVRKELQFIENMNSQDEIILSNERLYSYCINNKNVLIISSESFEENNKIKYLDRRSNENKEVDSIADLVVGKNKVYIFHNVDEYGDIANNFVLSELKKLNYEGIERNNGLFTYSVMNKTK